MFFYVLYALFAMLLLGLMLGTLENTYKELKDLSFRENRYKFVTTVLVVVPGSVLLLLLLGYSLCYLTEILFLTPTP